jgi:prophage regulatory protein
MQLVPYEELATRGIRYSKVQLWRLVREGKFPRPIKLSAQRKAWLASDLDQWIRDRIAATDAELDGGAAS